MKFTRCFQHRVCFGVLSRSTLCKSLSHLVYILLKFSDHPSAKFFLFQDTIMMNPIRTSYVFTRTSVSFHLFGLFLHSFFSFHQHVYELIEYKTGFCGILSSNRICSEYVHILINQMPSLSTYHYKHVLPDTVQPQLKHVTQLINADFDNCEELMMLLNIH